jgi:hypothetical protein
MDMHTPRKCEGSGLENSVFLKLNFPDLTLGLYAANAGVGREIQDDKKGRPEEPPFVCYWFSTRLTRPPYPIIACQLTWAVIAPFAFTIMRPVTETLMINCLPIFALFPRN